MSDEGSQLPLIDPTANVLKLVEQAVLRLNDLRTTDDKWSERLRLTEERCKVEEAALREKLSIAETGRLDAIRLADSKSVDAAFAEVKAAVSLASERVAAANATLATTLAATTAASNERMARIEQQQYQQAGREVQAGESRGQGNVNRGQLLSIAIAIAGWLFGLAMLFVRK